MTAHEVDASTPSDLGSSGARAVLWAYVSFASGKVLVLVTMAVLARLLTPEEFGIVGFATLAVGYLSVLKELGLGAAVIQRRDDVEESAQTVYTINLVVGLFLTAAAFLTAPLIAEFFREPLVTPILRVLSFTFILESLGAIHIVLLKRDLAFRRKLAPDIGRAAVKGVVSIAAAAAGFGVWALIWGQLAGVLAAVILSWAVMPWRPTFTIHRRLIRPLLGFGGPLVFTNLQYAIWSNLDYVVVGRLLGDTALGIYTLAYRLPELLIQSVWRVLAQAVFPVLSKVQNDPDMLRRAFLSTIRYTQMVAVPLSLGLLITAEPAVETLFGDQWSEAIPVLRVLAVFSLVGSVGVNVGDVYKALGRTEVLAKVAAVELVILVPAIIYGANFGLLGVAWAHAIVAALDMLIRLVVATRMVGFSLGDVWQQVRPSAIAGVWLSASSLVALWWSRDLGSFTSLAAAAIAGAVAYAVALWKLDAPSVRRMAEWVGLARFFGRNS